MLRHLLNSENVEVFTYGEICGMLDVICRKIVELGASWVDVPNEIHSNNIETLFRWWRDKLQRHYNASEGSLQLRTQLTKNILCFLRIFDQLSRSGDDEELSDQTWERCYNHRRVTNDKETTRIDEETMQIITKKIKV